MRRFALTVMTSVSDTAARWDAQAEVVRFGATLRDVALKRVIELAPRPEERARCLAMLAELLPRRIGAAQMTLGSLTRDDALDLREFVGAARDVADASIRSALSVEEICDTVGDALDSLHSFLLTHGLVPADYLKTLLLAEMREELHRPTGEEEAWEEVAGRADETSATSAANPRDLALAA